MAHKHRAACHLQVTQHTITDSCASLVVAVSSKACTWLASSGMAGSRMPCSLVWEGCLQSQGMMCQTAPAEQRVSQVIALAMLLGFRSAPSSPVSAG